MTYDPPSDPFGDERSCRICDGELTYNYLTREWECLADHDDADEAYEKFHAMVEDAKRKLSK